MGIADISLETRNLIDEQLIKIARINCLMGIDTKVDEKIEYRRQIRECLKEIKRLDVGFWEEIVPDKKEKF
jgi:uncharacterized protein with PIN domain